MSHRIHSQKRLRNRAKQQKITATRLLIGFRRKCHTIQGLCLERFLLKQAEIWEKQFLCHKVNVDFPPNTSSKQMEGGYSLFGLLGLVLCECLSKVCQGPQTAWHRYVWYEKWSQKKSCFVFKVLQGATALVVRRSLWEMLVSLWFEFQVPLDL